ncbi:hypothetical protein SAMN05216525_10465 [Bradyrhizobium sp. Gha]|nr:hypothetical protein SAMN05216525_10465 [Bradyrhizobium sp. Gha]
MPDAPGSIRVLSTRAPIADEDGKDITIPLQTDQNGIIEAVFSREALTEVAFQLGQAARQHGSPARLSMIPRRISVIKDHRSPDTFLHMEIDDSTTYIVPVGPRLLSTLIDGLDRARRVTPPVSTRQ